MLSIQFPTCKTSFDCDGPPCKVAPSCPLRLGIIEGAMVTIVAVAFAVTVAVVVIAGHGSETSIASIGGIATFFGIVYTQLRNGFAQADLKKSQQEGQRKQLEALTAAKEEVQVDVARAKKSADVSIVQTIKKSDEIIAAVAEVHEAANGNSDKRAAENYAAGIAIGEKRAIVQAVPVVADKVEKAVEKAVDKVVEKAVEKIIEKVVVPPSQTSVANFDVPKPGA